MRWTLNVSGFVWQCTCSVKLWFVWPKIIISVIHVCVLTFNVNVNRQTIFYPAVEPGTVTTPWMRKIMKALLVFHFKQRSSKGRHITEISLSIVSSLPLCIFFYYKKKQFTRLGLGYPELRFKLKLNTIATVYCKIFPLIDFFYFFVFCGRKYADFKHKIKREFTT